MYTFKKGSDIAQLENNKVQLHLSIYIKKVDGTFLIEVPSLDLHSYTSSEVEIDSRIDESLTSFFTYWLKVEGKEKFIEHMLALGFKETRSTTINITKSTGSKRTLTRAKTKCTLDEELIIA